MQPAADPEPPLDTAGVIEAGRAIRAFLPDLVGPPSAADLDTRISGVLSLGTPGFQALELTKILRENPTTADFLDEVLADAPSYRPPAIQSAQSTTRGVDTLPGDVGPIGATRYECPDADFVWWRAVVGAPVPACPTHGLPLLRR
jgi:hypothetical protein